MAEVWFEAVPGTRFGSVRRVDRIGSTNTELMDMARHGAAEGEVLIAEFQSAGRGRRGRTWVAPAGTSLMMSVLLRPSQMEFPLLPIQAGLVVAAWACAAAQACEQVAGVVPRLKWPNDLVIAGAGMVVDRKVAGILAESSTANGTITALVIGMGLNTGWPQVPPELADFATSLNLESGRPIDRARLAVALLTGFEQRYAALGGSADGAEQVIAEVRRRSATLAKRVQVQRDPSAGGMLVGQATDVDFDGALLVTDDSGTSHKISAGEVVHLRPAHW